MLAAGGTHKAGQVRAMREDDLEQIAEIFGENFRGGSAFDTAAFADYVRSVYLDSPFYSEELGSQVYEEKSGRIAAAFLSLPMGVQFEDAVHSGRLLSFFMKRRGCSDRCLLPLFLTLRPNRQDFAFSDTANAISLSLVQAGGGEVLPIQSLRWRRVFRPGSFLGSRFATSAGALAGPFVRGTARLLDPLARTADRGLRIASVTGIRARDIDLMEFRDHAETLLKRFAVRPNWCPDEYGWIVRQALKSPHLGSCKAVRVDSSDGTLRGAYVYFIGPRKQAEVFNILAAPGGEQDVIDQMLGHFDEIGCVSASGMAQPFLMTALSAHKYVDYRHKGHFYVLTRHQAVLDAVRRHDVYLGGFASESWNRLLTDFKGRDQLVEAVA